MIHVRNFKVGLVVLAIFAAVSFIAPMPRIQAQDDPIPTVIEVTGQVESFVVSSTGVTGLVIGGETFEVGLVNVSGIELGDWVTVVANLSEDNVYTLQTMTPEGEDIDGDLVLNDADNCPLDINADQLDTDGDGVGDACQTDEEDDGDEDDDEEDVDDEEETACESRSDHPVATALAAEFDVDYDTVMGWHCDGFGFGEISRALLLAEQSEDDEEGQDAEAYLEMKAGGMGWGQIVKESGVNPSELAQGRVISQKNKDKDKDGDDEDGDDDVVQSEEAVTGPGNSGNNGNNGNGGGNGNNGNNGNGGGNNNGNNGNGNGNNGNNGNGGGNGNNGNNGNNKKK